MWFGGKVRYFGPILLCSLAVFLVACGDPDSGALEFSIEAEQGTASSIPTIDEIAPYDEALTVAEYRVVKRISGSKATPKNGSVIRVASWAVVAGVNQPAVEATVEPRVMRLTPLAAVPGLDKIYRRNDLDFDEEEVIYLDLSQSLATPATPKVVRYDYRGPISYRMRIYWKARHQLRLAVLGNSHTGAGVDPQQFFQPENETIPVALNLAIAGSELPAQCLIADEYLVDLPKLEWVLWGLSPRMFNRHRDFDRRGEIFKSSPGYSYDQLNRNQLWPVDTTIEPVTADVLEDVALHEIEPWGWSPATHRDLPVPITAAAEEKILHECRKARFRWNDEAWDMLVQSIDAMSEQGLRLLLFIPPYHPLVQQGKAADFDGTGHDDYLELVERLETMAAENDHIVFLDAHLGGAHEFAHEDFADPDHLHLSGAQKLTRMLIEIVEGE